MEWHDENEMIRKLDAVEAVINMADTLDDVVGILMAVPEVKPPEGKWKRTERDIGMNYPEIVWTCSKCGEFTSVRGYKYCPHCGSRNEEE